MIGPNIARFPSNYWGEVQPGITASPGVSDIGHEAKTRLGEIFRQGVEYYADVAVDNIQKKVDRLKRKKEQRFGTDDDARQAGLFPYASNATPSTTTTLLLIAGVAVVGYLLWKRG